MRTPAAYTLNFNKRVKCASVKNLQVVNWDHNTGERGNDICLQFGKLADNSFALDFGFPFSIETAFAMGECGDSGRVWVTQAECG